MRRAPSSASAITSCCHSPGTWPRPTSVSPRGLEALFEELVERDPRRTWLPADPGIGDAAAQRASLRPLPRAPARGTSPVRGGGRSCPTSRVAPTSTRSSGSIPHVERGEAVNVGVVLLCRSDDFVGARTSLDEARLMAIAPDADVPSILRHLEAIDRVAGRRRPRRPDRAALERGAVPLARVSGEHDHPAVRGPHRSDRRSGRGAGAPVRRRSFAEPAVRKPATAAEDTTRRRRRPEPRRRASWSVSPCAGLAAAPTTRRSAPSRPATWSTAR